LTCAQFVPNSGAFLITPAHSSARGPAEPPRDERGKLLVAERVVGPEDADLGRGEALALQGVGEILYLPGGPGPIPVPGRDASPGAEWAARTSFADEQRILRTGCEPKGQAARRVRRLLAPLPLRVTNGGVRLDATRSARDTPCRRVGLSKRFLPERSPTWRTSSSRTYA
jgi:hypothetical protein